jgi:hypothetical protein
MVMDCETENTHAIGRIASDVQVDIEPVAVADGVAGDVAAGLGVAVAEAVVVQPQRERALLPEEIRNSGNQEEEKPRRARSAAKEDTDVPSAPRTPPFSRGSQPSRGTA